MSDCLKVTSWEDTKDGEDYRFVFKVTHTGHQSYGQTIVAQMSVPVTVTETDGRVEAKLDGNTVTLVRHDQMNDNGLVELWVKMRAGEHPTVVSAEATDCVREPDEAAR